MNKGTKTIIGAVVGFFLFATILSAFECEMGFNVLTIILFMPGAIVGAIVGSKIGDNNKKVYDENKNNKNEKIDRKASELLKFKQLLDEGIITQDEYQKMKNEFLENI